MEPSPSLVDGSHTHRLKPLVGESYLWGAAATVNGSARVQLSEQEDWTFPKVSKELWWFCRS